jgi:hypothetical protein
MRLLLLAACSLALTACTTTGPASVAGECKLFSDPGFAVRGERIIDQRWISKAQESGIAACGWKRPTE